MLSKFFLYVVLAVVVLLTYLGLKRIFKTLFKGSSCCCNDKKSGSSCCQCNSDEGNQKKF